MSIEAMKQALEALENKRHEYRAYQAITALRQAIEQAEKQEPVDIHCPSCLHPFAVVPVAEREWVGLNWDDVPDVFVGDIAFMQGAKWALAKLKEKNT